MSLEPLGGFRAGFGSTPGLVALATALGAAAYLQRVQLALRRAEPYVWWASNGRDAANVVSLLGLGAALLGIGFPGPSALVVSGTTLVLLNILSSHLAGWRSHRLGVAVSALATAAVFAVLAVRPGRVHAVASEVATRLFP